MLTREICNGCHRENPLGFTVPDHLWAQAVPTWLRDSSFCIVCFDELATLRGVDWAPDVIFHPVSGVAFQRFLAAADDGVIL